MGWRSHQHKLSLGADSQQLVNKLSAFYGRLDSVLKQVNEHHHHPHTEYILILFRDLCLGLRISIFSLGVTKIYYAFTISHACLLHVLPILSSLKESTLCGTLHMASDNLSGIKFYA
jgi:hypothetical protein